jgi:CheY-like chemotaxis protein
MAKILVVDDDLDTCELRKMLLTSAGHTVQTLTNGMDTERALYAFAPDLVITDILMPGVSGAVVYDVVRATLGDRFPVIVSSSTSLHLRGGSDPFLGYALKHEGEDKLLKLVDEMLQQ